MPARKVKLYKCSKCGEYTLSREHCNAETRNAEPPRYSPQDKYGSLRRKALYGI